MKRAVVVVLLLGVAGCGNSGVGSSARPPISTSGNNSPVVLGNDNTVNSNNGVTNINNYDKSGNSYPNLGIDYSLPGAPK